MQKTFIVRDEAETTALAKRFAKIVKKGDVLALYGTLGMGKSVFARGLIQKLTAAEEVPSPTFTLVQGYDAPQFEIYHFDLYRLKDPDEVFELGFEEAVYGGVCLIEWPEKAGNWLPKDIFKLEITPYASGRKITVDVSSEDKIKRLEQI
jgi:tRNA threonylcarbamoyl adenosine modification protein YjeE